MAVLSKLISSPFFLYSVRAWRGLRFNEKYAAKLEEKRIRESANKLVKDKAQGHDKKRANPFAVRLTFIFTMGADLFTFRMLF